MLYTNHRANAPGLDGVKWAHGTRIGIAESSDGGAKGQHPCVVVNGDKAFIFYFTHYGQAKDYSGYNDFSRSRRTVIQVAELKYFDGQIICDRDEPVNINFKAPESR